MVISALWKRKDGRKEMFYLTTHSTHFIYGYMASDIWLRTTQIVREETRCCHIGYSFCTTQPLLHQLWSTSWIRLRTKHIYYTCNDVLCLRVTNVDTFSYCLQTFLNRGFTTSRSCKKCNTSFRL